jgi:hypothetical protein
MDGRPSARSARWIEDCEIPDRSDSSRADQFSSPRAARIWAEVTLVFSLMAILACPNPGETAKLHLGRVIMDTAAYEFDKAAAAFS